MTPKTKSATEGAAKLPTAYQALNNHLSRAGLTLATAHESILLDAIESHTAAHTAGLRESIASLTHQRDFYRKKFNESKEVHITKDLGIPENIEMAPIVQSDIDALRERVKELEEKNRGDGSRWAKDRIEQGKKHEADMMEACGRIVELEDRVKELQAKIASYESAIDGLKKVVDSLYNLKS